MRTINSAGNPTPIRTGGCPWCGMGIQSAGTPDAFCGWCPWPDLEALKDGKSEKEVMPE